MVKYQKCSELFKFNHVTQFLNQKNTISLNLYAKSISGIDNGKIILKESINESTFRHWIKNHRTYDCEQIFNLLSNTTNTNNNFSKHKKQKIQKLEFLNNTLPDININYNYCDNKIISNKIHNNNKIKQKRMKYSFTFKKKWVSIYKYYLNKLTSLQLTFFSTLINGKDGNNIIKKGTVTESTFRKWIKL